MFSDLTWNLVAELFVSCSPVDINDDFRHAEKQVQEIVDRTGLSPAQRKRLRAEIIKAGLHGFGQIAKSGECIYIIIQMYMKDSGPRVGSHHLTNFTKIKGSKENQLLQSDVTSEPSRECGWGYFLIERIADRQEKGQAAASYVIEIFLYNEG